MTRAQDRRIAELFAPWAARIIRAGQEVVDIDERTSIRVIPAAAIEEQQLADHREWKASAILPVGDYNLDPPEDDDEEPIEDEGSTPSYPFEEDEP